MPNKPNDNADLNKCLICGEICPKGAEFCPECKESFEEAAANPEHNNENPDDNHPNSEISNFIDSENKVSIIFKFMSYFTFAGGLIAALFLSIDTRSYTTRFSFGLFLLCAAITFITGMLFMAVSKALELLQKIADKDNIDNEN